MADSTDDNVDVVNGVPRRLGKQASPGLSGAIKDAIGAVAKAVAPKSLTQFDPNVDKHVDDATGRMRQAQSTDRDNSYGGQ